jgi:hypothetical protein
MLNEGETSVFLSKRFFDKLPMTDFCKNQNISKLKIGPFQGIAVRLSGLMQCNIHKIKGLVYHF